MDHVHLTAHCVQRHLSPALPGFLSVSSTSAQSCRSLLAKVAMASLAGQRSMGPCPCWNHRTAQVVRDFRDLLVQPFMGRGA